MEKSSVVVGMLLFPCPGRSTITTW